MPGRQQSVSYVHQCKPRKPKFFIGDLLHVKSLFLAEQSERKHIERTGISKYKSEGSRLAT